MQPLQTSVELMNDESGLEAKPLFLGAEHHGALLYKVGGPAQSP